MRFTFLHAADLHIDSPLAALGLRDAAVAARFAKAGRRATEALVDAAIDGGAAFVVIAGDIFDGDWKDVSTGHFFVKLLGRLERAGIPAFIVRGNHDADSEMSRTLPFPEATRVFSATKAETFALEHLKVALHGRSFSKKHPDEDFVRAYPPARDGWLNIGVLHTALDGSRGHISYAPCTLEGLARFGYDYWALGHVHAAEVLARAPFVVYPGNLQGRSVRECGPKGAMRVTVEEGRVVSVEPLALDCARWAQEEIDITGAADERAVLTAIEARLAAVHATADGRPLAARLILVGETALHERLAARRETLEEDVRALGLRLADDCWVERLKLATRAPPAATAAAEPDALDLEGLLAATAAEPEFLVEVAALCAQIADKLPRGLREALPLDAAALGARAEAARDRLLGELADPA